MEKGSLRINEFDNFTCVTALAECVKLHVKEGFNFGEKFTNVWAKSNEVVLSCKEVEKITAMFFIFAYDSLCFIIVTNSRCVNECFVKVDDECKLFSVAKLAF